MNSKVSPTANDKPQPQLDAFERWGYINRKVLIYKLSETEQLAFKAGLKSLKDDRNKVEKYASEVLDDMLIFNKEANNTPIVWCFNHWSEPLLLARNLPKSVTLIAAVSAHQLTEKTDWRLKTRLHEHLVNRYLQTLKKYNLVSDRLLIGGNCQGAPVAESLAVRIKNQTNYQPHLIMLDYTPRKEYSGTSLMLFGKNSSYNPFNSEKDPLKIWETLRGKWQYRFLNATHGQYFREPVINTLSQLIVEEHQKLTTSESLPLPPKKDALPPVLLCVGFHRSATSAIANYLHNAGIHFGDDLIKPHIANPKGYYEDMPVVQMHESWLEEQGTSWQYHGEVPLIQKPAYAEQIKKYVAQRDKQGKPWALKDPRLCLFLPSWQNALKERGRYCVIVRSWQSCIESLHHRHSRELTYLTQRSRSPQHLLFWQTEALAAKMWIHYNQQLLSFIRQNRSRCVVMTHKAAFSDAPVLRSIDTLGNFALDHNAASPFTEELVRETTSLRHNTLISPQLRNELDNLWRSLLHACDYKAENELVSTYYDANTPLITSLLSMPPKALALSHQREGEAMQALIKEYSSDNTSAIKCYFDFYGDALGKIEQKSLLKHYSDLLTQCVTAQSRFELAARIFAHLQKCNILTQQQGGQLKLSRIPPLTAHQTRLFPKNQGADKVIINGLAAKCDWVLLSDHKAPETLLVKQRNIDVPKTIFISFRNAYNALAYFYKHVLPQVSSPFIIISGSEDTTFPEQIDKRRRAFNEEENELIENILENSKLIHWFAENLSSNNHSKLSPIPLGLVYPNSKQNPSLSWETVPPTHSRPNIVLCAHRVREDQQWDLRKRVTNIAKNDWQPYCQVLDKELSERTFLTLCKTVSFVVCVEGGGLDPAPKVIHSILMGAIPIIKRSPTSEAYAELPVVFVEEWTTSAISEKKLEHWKEQLSQWYDEPEKRIQVLKKLDIEYWCEKLNARLQQC